MRTIVVNDTFVNDRLSVSLTPGQTYKMVVNTPVITAGADKAPSIPAVDPPGRQAGDRTIDLIIRDKDTNLPMPHVVVTLAYPDGCEEDVVADEAGRIHIDGVAYTTFSVIDVYVE
jgi:hypothetical protein